MNKRNYSVLLAELSEEYKRLAPSSAAMQVQAVKYLIDGGSHNMRLLQPMPPRIKSAHGAWIIDEDGNRILDFWQGHYVNILGHNPEVVTSALSKAFGDGFGLQTGFTDRNQVEAAEILCRQTGAERIRFTSSGTLATMYCVMLSLAFTGRDYVMKTGGGWHGSHPWGLKGVRYNNGFESVESSGINQSLTDNIIITGFNNTEILQDHFRKYGGKLACFIVEPVIGQSGLMPASEEYIRTARELTEKYGVLLIFDEIVSAFRFRAGNAGALYNVQPDLMALGKSIGGGMPVAAVAGHEKILSLVGREKRSYVKFSGGTFSAHPASMLASKVFMEYLVRNESSIYPAMTKIGEKCRRIVEKVFNDEGIHVRFSGDRINAPPSNSLHMLLFPYNDGHDLKTPEEVLNPEICDILLSEKVLQLALLLENVFTVHGLGCTTYAHTYEDIEFLGEAYTKAARRIKQYL